MVLVSVSVKIETFMIVDVERTDVAVVKAVVLVNSTVDVAVEVVMAVVVGVAAIHEHADDMISSAIWSNPGIVLAYKLFQIENESHTGRFIQRLCGSFIIFNLF
jgi:hypothetical protein